MKSISIPRCIKPSGFGASVQTELHGFSDASSEAIGFIIYIKLVNVEGNVAVSFLHANSKVAPQCANTIPRLELCGALELARAMAKVRSELMREISNTYLYTDSKIVLGYINNPTKRFSRYVSYRVAEITSLAPSSMWHFITGEENMGDIASRPQTIRSLLHTNWFKGPPFLHDVSYHPTPVEDTLDVELPEVKSLKTITDNSDVSNVLTDSICRKEISWMKACRITANVLKFIHLLRKCCDTSCPICKLDVKTASKYLIKEAQRSVFSDELCTLSSSETVSSTSKLLPLSPYLDEDAVIRVGGRLKNSNFPGDIKHPILLPNNHIVTTMIVRFYHSSVRHQGRYITAGSVRQAGFHIFKGPATIKKMINNCVVCRKMRGSSRHQRMADLPPSRLEESPPFTHVGLDLFGPYLVHDGISTRRTKASKKVWVLLVTCLVSRAIHVEVLPYLDTHSLQLGLRRFYSVRGTCKTIKSDRGSNLVGAINQLIDYNMIKTDAEKHGIVWELIPPGASSWGGVWERKVGSIKRVLDGTFLLQGKQNLSRDEFITYVQECASVVNNTPLWDTSSSPDDPAPLSPANLLTLRDEPNPSPLDSYSPNDLLSYGKLRWKRVMYLSEQFWMRWRQHYLHSLQHRKKWHEENKGIEVGDVVLVRGPAKRNKWPVGRIVEVIKGREGLVRSVRIKLPDSIGKSNRILERCVRDTVLLVSSKYKPETY